MSTDGEHRGTFVVARFVAAERAEVAETVEVAGAVIGLLLLLATGLAWGATGRALAPVRLLTKTARSLGDSDCPSGSRHRGPTRSASSL
ncbi:MAG: hypothetical protein M3P96_05240 [Actinomycetota bacterium]|nr:hypothetical protein [Actinomycetota bacterium]